MQAIFGGAMPDRVHACKRAFLLCQIWKNRNSIQNGITFVQNRKESFMHILVLGCKCVCFELDHSIRSSIYFTLAIRTATAAWH